MRIFLITLLLVAAGTSTSATAGSAVPMAPKAAPAPVAKMAVVLRHGPMSWVSDTPKRQMTKAHDKLAGSALVKALADLGVAVSYEPTDRLDDLVVVADGQEIARANLHELLTGGDHTAVLAAVKAHFKR